MEITTIKPHELCEVMQLLNLLKVKFGSRDTWIVAPMLFATDETVDIIINSLNSIELQTDEEVTMKFQKFGYEYIVGGKTACIGPDNPGVVSVKLTMAQRYFNLRKYMRFDTDLKAILRKNQEQLFESRVKNISRGGAMIVSDADLEMNSFVNTEITFESRDSFLSSAKVLRKSLTKDNCFSYGIQFVNISEDDNRIFNREIRKYEKEYFSTLDILREYTNKSDSNFDTKISILCYDAGESYEIREVLVKMGAENFDVLHDFRFYSDYFMEEKPKIVVVDADILRHEISDMVVQLTESFPDIKVILLLPLSNVEEEGEGDSIPEAISILYKPLIFNEFEKEIIKYL